MIACRQNGQDGDYSLATCNASDDATAELVATGSELDEKGPWTIFQWMSF
jgi:hypothetical protein